MNDEDKRNEAREVLLRRDLEWAAVAHEGMDVERIISYWTDDATMFPPRKAVLRGKDAIRSYVVASLGTPGFSIQWVPQGVDVSADLGMACVFTTNKVTVRGDAGELVTSCGRGVTLWRRNPRGEWRCFVDIWNEEAP
jgi:ketosteroid isomerase-like protein